MNVRWLCDVKTFCEQKFLRDVYVIGHRKVYYHTICTIADTLKMKVPSTELLMRSLCASLIWSSLSSRKPVQSERESSSPVIASRHLYCLPPWQVHSWAGPLHADGAGSYGKCLHTSMDTNNYLLPVFTYYGYISTYNTVYLKLVTSWTQ
jgi:hypothetical protein